MEQAKEKTTENEFKCDICHKEFEEICSFTSYGWGNEYKLPRIRGNFCEKHINELEDDVRVS